MSFNSRRIHPAAVLLSAMAAAATICAAQSSTVKVWEENTVIPTYAAGSPEPSPMFYFGRQSQGAQAPIYPYPNLDVLTSKKVDRTYKEVYLENEYLKIGILPELGGRIFEGLDKTNNYNFIYRQHVIKPALITITGAWISGGVEWNIPHHHRASTFMPVQYKIEENADGSKTVWVGELEIRQRMRWAVGYTLRPGKSYLEASLRIVNRTPEVNTMLCFANVAVHTNDNYQVIFPPSTQWGTGHSKRVFQKWPISDNPDGTKTDVSMLKNHFNSTSIFAWNYDDDFFAGYDHGKDAGTMSIADHNVVPGKKFFTWGKGPSGQTWDKALTDDDGPYIELMVGAYSDNQPDYSWLEPYEGRTFSMSWYPFRNIGGVKRANLDAAVNLDVEKGVAKVGFYTTSARTAARVTLMAGKQTLLNEVVAINPGKPYRKDVQVPAGIDEHDLVAAITDGGKELVSYSPIRLTPEAMPKPVTPPVAPADMKTSEELYLTGLRAQQFHDPTINPEPYWAEALRRDPGDSRVNTAMGIVQFKMAHYDEAEKFFRKAIERVTDRFTSPKDGEAFYYLAATLKAQGKQDEAYTYFYKATWSQEWKAAGYYGLAEIATGRGNMTAAMDFVDRSIDANAFNIRAQNLKAAVLRHLGRSKEAAQVLAAAYKVDPLDVRSMAERWLASKDAAAGKVLSATLYEHPATAQETAAEYLNAGLWQDGTAILQQLAASAPDKAKVHPMAYYYLAYFAEKQGQAQQAAGYRKQAMALSPEYVFPFQAEAIGVLESAVKADAKDARARYYLGNLLYDWQPEAAVKLWEASAAIDPTLAMVHRNLATAYAHLKPAPDTARAIAELEKAVACERKYPLHFAELDELYEQTAVPVEKRLPMFEKNAQLISARDDAQNRAVALMVAMGKYDDAIQVMTGKKFTLVEGQNLNVSEHWTNAHILRGRKRLAAKQYKEALADFEAASKIPANLPGTGNRNTAELRYWTGLAYEGLGERQKATESWTAAVAPAPTGGGRRGGMGGGFGGFAAGGAQSYYQALCQVKLGQADKAKAAFQELVNSGQRAVEQQPAQTGGGGRGRPQSARVRQAMAHYTMGLGYLGLSDVAKAKAALKQSLELSPDLLGARTALADLD